jgi:hypothetical protein
MGKRTEAGAFASFPPDEIAARSSRACRSDQHAARRRRPLEAAGASWESRLDRSRSLTEQHMRKDSAVCPFGDSLAQPTI